MMKNFRLNVLIGICALLLLSQAWVVAKEYNPAAADRTKSALAKTMKFDRRLINVNTIAAWFENTGEFYGDAVTSSSGFEWPKAGPRVEDFCGNPKAIFSSGLWLGAIKSGTVRLACVGHGATEHQAGMIDPNTGRPDDWRKSAYKLYIIKPLEPNNPNFQEDYDNWPVDQGAPVDANGKPALIWGGEAQYPDLLSYCVYNDAEAAAHTHRWGTTLPLGAEVRQTVWAYDRTGAFGQMHFIRFEIRNLGDKPWENTYISVWTDPDLGDANDDLVAVDEARNLGICYNGSNYDVRYGEAPPAVGYVFFQGPNVPSVGDTALWSGEKRPDFRNLGVSSFNMYINPTVTRAFPDPSNSTETYNYMQGFKHTGEPWVNPLTNQESKFVVNGDPVRGTGWLDGGNPPNSGPPDDRRFLLTTGPFTMNPGDVQQVVVGVIIARGANNLDSITKLRTFTDASQKLFDLNFKLPPPPAAPKIDVTFDEASGKIVLTWDSKAEKYFNSDFNLRFHGYNVYQALSASAPASEYMRLASFYRTGGADVIYDLKEFEGLPDAVLAPIWKGETEGIQNFMVLEQDAIARDRFIPGVPYYFAVTSFAINPDAPEALGLRYLENSLNSAVFEIIPQRPVAGTEFPTQLEQVLKTNRPIDDQCLPTVISPWVTTDRVFKVVILGDSTNVTGWNLLDKTTGDTLASRMSNFSGNDAYPVLDGILHKLVKNPVGVRRDSQSPMGYKYEPAENLWFTPRRSETRFWNPAPTGFDAYSNSITYPVLATRPFQSALPATRLRQVEIRFSKNNTQKAYRYVHNTNKPLANPNFQGYIEKTGQFWVYQDYRKNPKDDPSLGPTVPFTVWEKDPIYGSERQLNVGFIEMNDSTVVKKVPRVNASGDTISFVDSTIVWGAVDGKWWPTKAANGGGDILVIFASNYNDNALPEYSDNLFIKQRNLDLMYVVWLRSLSDNAAFKDGDKFTITPNYPLFAGRTTFEYSAGKPAIGSPEVAKTRKDLEQIKAVPNPFYGLHRLQRDAFDRYINFTNLPRKATIRIFNLAGQLIKVIEHQSSSDEITGSMNRWDMTNHQNLPVASGLYIAHITAPGIGEKIIKIVVFLQEERLDLF